jgi:hypothetical protein
MKTYLLRLLLVLLMVAGFTFGCSSAGHLVSKPTGSGTADGGIIERDFVISVETNLPHRFPEGETKGVWLSSIPLALDVYAYPKGSKKGRSVRFSEGVRGHYYLGQTPLLANLKNGTYEIDFVHPPLTDENFKSRHWTRLDKRYGIILEAFPFIAPRNPWLKAEAGDYYWVQRVEVEVNDDFNTAIVLFQREDQETADMLALLPPEKNFEFHATQFLTNNHWKEWFIRANYSESEAATFSLTSEEFAQAIEMLERGGVWAKRFNDKASFAIEVHPNGLEDFRGIVRQQKRAGPE